jgi:hypothetical protein
MIMPVIVNVRGIKPNDPSIFYCGREFGGWNGSILGNLFYLSSEDKREECVDKYRKWLFKQIELNNEPIINAIKRIKEDSKLGCWCYPKLCHCSVIIEAWKILC